MTRRSRIIIAALVAAAAIAVVAIGFMISDDDGGRAPPDQPGAVPQELAFLPPSFPRALVREASQADITRKGDRLVIRLELSRPGSPADAMFFYSERLRDAGWNAPPSEDASRTSFSGFGWEGEANARQDGSRSQIVVVMEGESER